MCLGPSGVGKTLAARRYAQWPLFDHLTNPYFERLPAANAEVLVGCDTVLYTPSVTVTTSSVLLQLLTLMDSFETTMLKTYQESGSDSPPPGAAHVKLIIIDEANRLKYQALEQVRDLFDQLHVGIVFLGLHGLEKYISCLPQLRGRVGFRHEFKPLSGPEMLDILESEQLNELGYGITNQHFDSQSAITYLARATGGNMRTLNLLCLQIRRVLRINNLELITIDVIEAARRALIIGI